MWQQNHIEPIDADRLVNVRLLLPEHRLFFEQLVAVGGEIQHLDGWDSAT